MTSQTKRFREMAREKAQRRRKKQRNKSILLVIVGVGILISIGFLIYNDIPKKPQVTEIEYSEEDIVYGEPLHAIHEMSGAALSEIPFLPEDEPQPQIEVSETIHNLGVVGAAEVVSYDYVIKNVGEAPLTISRAYTTCGCTTADFSATVIPPGKVVIMTLVFDAGFHDLRGQTVRRGVIIENNDPNVPQLELWASASVAKN